MTALANDLAARGIAAWNVEYRGTGRDGGGWPETLLDVGRAIDHLASIEQVDRSRVVTCGHSAGGHLALWAAARTRLPSASELPGPQVVPRAAVSLAGVCDLVAAARDGLGADAAQALLGATPDEEPARYAQASPAALLPLDVPVLLVHGERDGDVPIVQSRAFAESVTSAGGSVELVELADADHFDVIDPAHAGWRAVVERLPALLAPSSSRPAQRRRTGGER
jgi:acetyl esterase/lipase